MNRHRLSPPNFDLILVKKTNVPGEEEYLFEPYSAFTVLNAQWKAGTVAEPHEIELLAAADNKEAPEDLPLAPSSRERPLCVCPQQTRIHVHPAQHPHVGLLQLFHGLQNPPLASSAAHASASSARPRSGSKTVCCTSSIRASKRSTCQQRYRWHS